MSDIIHLLPESVANQVAAVEVIQRPASVVKELVENAIDAGATKIQILIKDAGKTAIQVIDNGKGMSETDARMSFERHATSKIKEAKDLFALRTMGFRGEALASIASIAHVELRTRQPENETGILIEIEGVFKKQEIISCPIGSSFLIKNLFFNVPARRKFLKSNNTEFRHITDAVQRIALTYPEVEFILTHNDREIYNLPDSNLRQRIINLFGKKINQQLVQVEAKTGLVNISGFTAKSEFAFKGAPQFFFVNGRYMRHPYFHRAVMEAYSRMLKPDTTPSYFIYFDINPANIDVNVSPTKTEIKFQDECEIFQILMVCIKEALGKFNVSPSIDFDTEGSIDIPTLTPQERNNIKYPEVRHDNSYNPFAKSAVKQTPVQNWDTLYRNFEYNHAHQTVFDEKAIEQDAVSPLFANEKSTDQSHFQYKNKYILTAVKSGLMLIDQQRAHTQILYEQYIIQISCQKGVSQQVLFPETLELDTSDSIILKELTESLRYLGFELEDTGENKFNIIGIPASLTENGDITSIVKEMIYCRKETDLDIKNNLNERLAFSLARAASIPNNRALGNMETSDLVDKLFRCKNHQSTYDGKPIITIISDEDIDKKF